MIPRKRGEEVHDPNKKRPKRARNKNEKMREKERGGTLLSFFHTCASK
jgi:hypothetical protein